MRTTITAITAIAAAALMGWAPAASGGIIVTVGKVTADGDDSRRGECNRLVNIRPNSGPSGESDSPPSTSPLSPAKLGNDGESKRGTNLGDWPPGCRPIGGGLLYCETEEAAGAAAGAEGGAYLDDYDVLDDHDEIAVFGCQGGPSSAPVGVAALLLLLVALRARSPREVGASRG